MAYLICLTYRITKEPAAMMSLWSMALPNEGMPSYDLILLTDCLFDYPSVWQWLIERLKGVSSKFN
ncbi:hypothetical protein POH93_06575 [Phytobacter diazotrophicus]|uniref:hypothetical protein n=1 Tax=Phytobacter diazotrophicus TaxID=395631 RepID=UPI00232B1427|nr:hypothetical protein [Phytobacter diazotrophicus]MDC0725054.1 hypothetical protein [Phytobacter diazotrophicus]MDC0732598.1 hypothetical protein [Phytobacter diazotrophicus]